MNHLDLSDGNVKNARAIIWRGNGATRQFLITQEFSGTFTVPGGAKDLEDESIEVTMERELFEELGLRPEQYHATRIDWSKEYENLYRDPASERHGRKTIIYPFLIFTKGDPVLLPREGEIEGAAWVDEAEALRRLAPSAHMKEIFEIGLKNL
jgi:8-oxo-dGTP pyrophosphatase MutT (NUDIX family)